MRATEARGEPWVEFYSTHFNSFLKFPFTTTQIIWGKPEDPFICPPQCTPTNPILWYFHYISTPEIMFLQILDLENWSYRCFGLHVGAGNKTQILFNSGKISLTWNLTGFAQWSGRPRDLPISASPILGLPLCASVPGFSVLILGLNSGAHICGKCFSDWAITPALWVWRGKSWSLWKGKR